MQEKKRRRTGYAEAFIPVQSDSQTSEWYSYFENDVLTFVVLYSSISDNCSAEISLIIK